VIARYLLAHLRRIVEDMLTTPMYDQATLRLLDDEHRRRLTALWGTRRRRRAEPDTRDLPRARTPIPTTSATPTTVDPAPAPVLAGRSC
jgi:hypothetical protein